MRMIGGVSVRGKGIIPTVLLCCLLFLTACGNRSPTTVPLAAHTVTLAVEESDLDGYRPLVELFTTQHPDIDVHLVIVGEVTTGNEPDPIAALAAAADVFPYAPDVQRGHDYLLDLEPLLSLDPTFQPDDFQPGLFDGGSPVWSIPVAANYPLVFFDKAAFDVAGMAYPQPGWTLDEFLAAAQSLTLRDGEMVIHWGYVPYFVQPLLSVQLTAPLLPESGPARFTDPDVSTAVQWVAELFTTHQVSPWLDAHRPFAERTGGQPDPSALVDAGQAAMWSGGHVRWQFMDHDNVGVTTMPRGQEGYALEPIRYAFAISRGTAEPQAAWQLLTFLSQQPPVSGVIDLLVPARRSVAAADGFWDRVPEPLVEPLQYATANNTGPRAAIWLLPAVAAVVDRGESVANALADVQAAVAGGAAEPGATAAPPAGVAIPDTEGSVTEILFVTTWNEAAAQRELAKAFHKDHPDIRVTVRRRDTANDFYQEVASADCFAGSILYDRLAESVRPLDPILELDPSLRPDDFFPGTVEGLMPQEELLGLPAWIHVPLIEYNRKLFARAGVAQPAPSWTLVDFLETAQALTDARAGQYGYVDWSWQSLLSFGPAQFGVHLIGARENVDTVDYAAAAPMVGWYADLVALHAVHPVLPGDLKAWGDYFDRSDLFYELAQTDKVAMWPYMASDQTLREHLAGNVETGFVSVPQGPSGHSFSMASSLTAYFIAAETPYSQACWEWLKYLVVQPAAAPYLPAHVATAQSTAFAEHVGPELATALLSGVAGGSDQVLRTGQREEWLEPGLIWLTAAAETAAKGQMAAEDALGHAEDRFQRYRQCVMDQQAFDDARAWKTCAIQVDPALEDRYAEPDQ